MWRKLRTATTLTICASSGSTKREASLHAYACDSFCRFIVLGFCLRATLVSCFRCSFHVDVVRVRCMPLCSRGDGLTSKGKELDLSHDFVACECVDGLHYAKCFTEVAPVDALYQLDRPRIL